MSKLTEDYREFLLETLEDPKEAMLYLNAALQDRENPQVFIIALQDVGEAIERRNAKQEASRKGKRGRKPNATWTDVFAALMEHGGPLLGLIFEQLNKSGLQLKVVEKEKEREIA